MAETSNVDVAGLGRNLPVQAEFEFDGVTLRANKKVEVNHHNEARYTLECGPWTPVLKDHFNVSVLWDPTTKQYQLQISMDTYAGIAVYNNGTLTLVYDEKIQQWKLNAAQIGAKNNPQTWLYCAPEAVVANMVAGLECFAGSKKATQANLSGVFGLFSASIRTQRENIVKTAPLYAERTDCTKRESYSDDGSSTEMP